MSAQLSLTLIIITRNRPEMVQECLNHLAPLSPQPDQIVLVDSSDDEQTHRVADNFAHVQYIRLANGRNRMPDSRNAGLRVATGDIVAFLDDDSMAGEGWLPNLLEPFSDPEVGCVGGGVDEPGTEWRLDEPVGRVLANGDLSQSFSPAHEADREVDHVKGCNMSFRRDLLACIGGFDPGYTGDNLREDTDACLGIKKLGANVVFCPSAVVTHLRAPRKGITRGMGDPVKLYYNSRNHTYFILKHYPSDIRKLWANYIVDLWHHIRWLRPNRQLPGARASSAARFWAR